MNLNELATGLGRIAQSTTQTLWRSVASLNSNLVKLAKTRSSPPVKTQRVGVGGSLGSNVGLATSRPMRYGDGRPLLCKPIPVEQFYGQDVITQLDQSYREGWDVRYDILTNQYILERPYKSGGFVGSP